MKVKAESLHERYSSMDTEELADIYHAGGLTDLAVSVLKDVITSRGLDWIEFITPLPTEPESFSDWELWKSESPKVPNEIRLEPKQKASVLSLAGGTLMSLGLVIFGAYILNSKAVDIYRIANWQLVDGTVEGVSEEYLDFQSGITTFEIGYSYSVGEITYWGIHSDTFVLLPPPDYKKGTSIKVYYDENNPRYSLVEMRTWHHYPEAAAGLLLLGLGGISVFYLIVGRK